MFRLGVSDLGVNLAPADAIVVGNVCQDGLTGLDVGVAEEQVVFLSVCGGHCVEAGCGPYPLTS